MLVNGPYEDPGVYVRFLRERRAVLFDCGHIGRLAAADVLKLSDIFISHTHIDHFIGFDTILRTSLRREEPLRIFGPENITQCVMGKLAGYTWNLIHMYPLKIECFAIGQSTVQHTVFDARESFRPRDMGSTAFNGTLLSEDAFRIRAIRLDHGTPCMGYTLEEEFHINIEKVALDALGIEVGPWLAALKKAIREQRGDEHLIIAGDGQRTLGELRHIATISPGQKITYLTDLTPSPENITKALEFARASDTLYCESYFMHADIGRAHDRNHLTGKLSGWLARTAGARRYIPLHVSPKYRGGDDNPRDEAMAEFERAGPGDAPPL